MAEKSADTVIRPSCQPAKVGPADLSIRADVVRRTGCQVNSGGRAAEQVRESSMAKFVYVYTGGQMAATPQEQEQVMQAWGAWFGTLGDVVTDMGNPFGPSATVSSGAVSEGGASKASGYSILTADSLGAATEKAKSCPVLAAGGSVEVYEAIEM
jgi:hypothetical protein